MLRLMTTSLLAFAMSVPAIASAAEWQIDPSHSAAQFSVRHLMVSTVRGEFSKMSGKAFWDPAKPDSLSVEATVDASSINTREAKRDEHLRSDDFFDVANHPTLTFKSKKAKKTGKGKFDLVGDLTIRGVTKEVTFQVEGLEDQVVDPWGNLRAGATATTKINRKDFGLGWNQVLEAGGVMVGEEVTIHIDVELMRPNQATAASE